MNTFIKKFGYFHYNIGFFDFQKEILAGNITINWMKHQYKDRFFADPFILDVTPNEIKVLVEEFLYDRWKGNISLLTIDRNSYQLKKTKTLLDLETHLSFPFIFRTEKAVYVIPENSASGCLKSYRYNEEMEELYFESTLLDQSVIDPVIIQKEDHYILFGSQKDKNENSDLYVWQSEELLKGYISICNTPIKSNSSCARRGGDFFSLNGKLYSATQCCERSYGEALNICKVTRLSKKELTEEIVATLYPDKNHKEGLHTFNHYKEVCVVDGLTYLFRPLQKIITVINRIQDV